MKGFTCSMVSWFHLSQILITLNFQFHLSRSVNKGCQDAVYSVKVVVSCPASKEEWDAAARIKNCNKLAAEAKRKNCKINEKQPEYHCVMNALRNKLLEVCADKKTIFGYCPEFNEAGKVIQNHYSVPCKKVFPKCDKSFSSSDAYKYEDCYKLVNPQKVPTYLAIAHRESGTIITATFFAAAVLCVLAVATILFRKSRIRKDKPSKEKDEKEHQHLMDNGLENSINKEAESKPLRQFLYCEADQFEHFFYVYNHILKYKQRLENENENEGYDLTNLKPKSIIIKIEVEGTFTDDNLELLPKGNLNKKVMEDENIWKAIPLLRFHNDVSTKSALKSWCGEEERQVIHIKSVQGATDEADDSIMVVEQNKENILKAITMCLEQPLCHMLQEWLNVYSESAEKINEILDLKRMMLGHNENNETPRVPYDIKKYLSGKSNVWDFAMMKNNSLQVLVNKETDENELKRDLMEINPKFFEESRVEVDRKSIKRYTKTCIKINDDEKNVIAVNVCVPDFTKQNKTVCSEDTIASRQTKCSVVIEVEYNQ